MSSVQRRLGGDVLVHHLTHDETLVDQSLVELHGRSARTLVKEGSLRVTIIALGAKGDLPVHSAAGPISIQLLDGDITFTAAEKDYALAPRDLLVIAGGVSHSARSSGGGTFLLTVVHDPASTKAALTGIG